MRKLLLGLAVLAIIGAGVGWFLTAPVRLDESVVASLPEGDATAGEIIFWAGGCTSCHAAPGAKGDDKLVLAGGVKLKTPFGTFIAPNISPHKDAGIGSWTNADFANAMMRGVSPEGAHYYPAFPYTSYARMEAKDASDLFAFIKTLPESDKASADHALSFPFNIRRGLGLWKLLYLDGDPVIAVNENDAQLARGRYLVEALGHCGECHTPRNAIGGPDKSAWLSGGPAPEGDGKIPNITPHESGLADWSAGDIAEGLKTGFTPSFDSFGGSMVAVQENMAKLSEEDLAAISLYLKAVPPHPASD